LGVFLRERNVGAVARVPVRVDVGHGAVAHLLEVEVVALEGPAPVASAVEAAEGLFGVRG
jgi:hypothetical protein